MSQRSTITEGNYTQRQSIIATITGKVILIHVLPYCKLHI